MLASWATPPVLGNWTNACDALLVKKEEESTNTKSTPSMVKAWAEAYILFPSKNWGPAPPKPILIEEEA